MMSTWETRFQAHGLWSVLDAADEWLTTEAAAAYDALKADPSRAIPAEDVRAGFEATWAARSL